MSKSIAIMQPTYLPWAGYFALMDRVDEFVFLDSVQFERRSWQQRNRIKGANGEVMLTVPVRKAPRNSVAICDVQVDYDSKFVKKHIANLTHAYKKAPYFKEYSPRIFELIGSNFDSLADLTVSLVSYCAKQLGITTSTVRASELSVAGTKDELLYNICLDRGADSYISPPGSKAYLDFSPYFGMKGFPLIYHEYTPEPYRQLHGAFVPYMSIVDLLFNEGRESLNIIARGTQHRRLDVGD